MPRPRPRVLALLAVSLTLLVAGCSGGPETPILNRFFNASRLRDHTALQNFSTVAFEPRTDGIVTSFRITNVTPERRRPADLNAAETRVVALSVDDPRHPVDPTTYDVEIGSKDVTVSAPVKLPNGGTSNRTLIITMQRGVLKGDQPRTGRWIITAIRDTAAPAGAKTS